jgi:D-alanyl-lipoteichoic acid acyltransferase DltB (MBOAT superfamily)
MIFTSLQYIIFVQILFLFFIAVPIYIRWLVLLVGSYIFYASLNAPILLFALGVTTCVSYGVGISISRSDFEKTKKLWLWIGVVSNLSILICLKYLPFLFKNINIICDYLSTRQRFPDVSSIVTIGVSYYVLQGISYIVDVYLEVTEPERHFGYIALYMSFFPKLLQGPIERGGNLLPQLRILAPATWADIRVGLHLFLWGVFKKVVIADRLASFVDPIYGNVTLHSGLTLVAATYLFAFQLYFDFSGYTDMALGIARCFNIRLTQNFNAPYLATSIADFWRRWHISFSSWILDYIFKPLQFKYRDLSTLGTTLALMITFVSSGLWHGASWNYVVWGSIHGIYLSGAVLFRRSIHKFYKRLGLEKSKLLEVWQVILTFNLVSFAWIFFRARNLNDALFVAWNVVAGIVGSLSLHSHGWNVFILQIIGDRSIAEAVGVLVLLLFALTVGGVDRRIKGVRNKTDELLWLFQLPLCLRGIVYGLFSYFIIFCGVRTQSFIYLNF